MPRLAPLPTLPPSVLPTVLVSLLLLGAPACATLQALLGEAQALEEAPTLTFVSADVRDVTFTGLTVDTHWALHNPMPIGASVSTVEYALAIEGHQVIAGKPPAGLSVAPGATSTLDFPATIRFVDLGAVVDTLLKQDTARWSAQGVLGVQTPVGEVRLPISRSGEFEVPKVPQVQLQDPRVTNLTFAGATVEFPLVITNRNGFSLPINGLTGTVSIGGQVVGSLSSGDLGALTAKGTRTVALPLSVNFLSAAAAALQIANGGQAQVRVEAQLVSGAQRLPIAVDQLVHFVR